MTQGIVLPAIGPDEQGFTGAYPLEQPGWLYSDAHGGRYVRRVPFKVNGTPAVKHAHLHGALDIGVPVGTHLHASAPGIVYASGHVARFSDGAPDGEIYSLVLFHEDKRYWSFYLNTHLSEIIFPGGRRVTYGNIIALSGESGRVTGPHDHFQVGYALRSVDPMTFFSGSGWTWVDPLRVIEGGDMANLPQMIPNV